MTTGPRPTPYPIVIQIDASGTPVGIGESSSIYVSSVSAVTISATNYLGLGSLSGYPGGDLSSLQFKTGNTTFNGSPFLKYSAEISGLLANAVSSTRATVTNISAGNISATNISATTYLNLPRTNLSSLLDVQYASVSGGQSLVYSSSINKWAPGYRIFRSESNPSSSVGVDGDIYFQYINDSTNAAYLSSLLDTNITTATNGQSLVWNSGYWVPSAIPTGSQDSATQFASQPIWNAASANGIQIAYGYWPDSNLAPLMPAPFDFLGFTLEENPRITNFRLSSAGPTIVGQAILNNLSDLDVGQSQTNNILTKRSDGYWHGASGVNVGSISSTAISATNYYNIISGTPIWNANKIQNVGIGFNNPTAYDILAFNIAANSITNVPLVAASPFIANTFDLSSIRDVDDEFSPTQGNVLVYDDNYWAPRSPSSLINLPAEIGIAVTDEPNDLSAGTAKATFRMPFAMRVREVRANVNTAPVGANIIVDINRTGSLSILSTRITIEATEKTSKTATTQPVVLLNNLSDDDELTVDIDQIGSITPGKGLKIWLIGIRT